VKRAKRAGQASQTSGEIANLHLAVIACDKREAFAQGSEATKQSILAVFVAAWIASRSLSSGGALRRPVGSQ
jgi:hypothetical protein